MQLTKPTEENKTPSYLQHVTSLRTLNLLGWTVLLTIIILGGCLIGLTISYTRGQLTEVALIVALFGQLVQLATSALNGMSPSAVQQQQPRRTTDANDVTAKDIGEAVSEASEANPVNTKEVKTDAKDGEENHGGSQ